MGRSTDGRRDPRRGPAHRPAQSGPMDAGFQNLIGNAIKFCSDRPPEIQVGECDGKFWLVWVKDNGIGISPEHREQVRFNASTRGRNIPAAASAWPSARRFRVPRRPHLGRVQARAGAAFYFSIPAA